MWQLLVAAAVAGSTSVVAKRFLNPSHLTHQKPDQQTPAPSPFHSPPPLDGSAGGGYEQQQDENGVFRFSSSGSRGKKKEKNTNRSLAKKAGIPVGRLKYGGTDKSDGDEKGSGGGADGSGRRRSPVCLKKRRTAAKIATSKCGSSASSSKDGSSFGWGVGVGIMCMMSAGKAEISKLSAAMDETSKVVQELRAELNQRKSTQVAVNLENAKHTELSVDRSGTDNRSCNGVKVSGRPSMIDDVECPSSVLTEEPEPESVEMDQLEAELESELEKLPGSANEASSHEVIRSNTAKADISSQGFHRLEEQDAVSYQCVGVLPSELDQKLCHLLIEQQENQIVGLESELHMAQSKLHEKEAELQALKDCVRRLTNFSLSTVSDDEVETADQDCTCEWDNNSRIGSESRKSSVGMKRHIDSA